MQKWRQDFRLRKDRLVNDESGITLVELLAAISIFSVVILLGGAVHMFGQRQFINQTEGASQVNDLSYALTVMTTEIRKKSYDDLAESEVEVGEKEYTIEFTDGLIYKVEGNSLKENGSIIIESVEEMEVIRNDESKNIKVTLIGTDTQTQSKEYETTIYPRR